MDLRDRIRYAVGEAPVDLLLADCRLVNVLSGSVHPASVAVADGLVVGLDEGYEARETIDLKGRYLAPGFIDAHVHIESSMVSVGEYSRTVMPRGTTTVVADCHEIANVMGVDGIRFMLDSASAAALDVFVMLPSCVPATPLETSGADLEAEDLIPLLSEPAVIGLGELMNFPGTITGDPQVLAKLEAFRGKPVDGHCPGLSGKELSAYIAAGPDSDHECTGADEAMEKLRKGMHIFMREGTGAHNLLDLLPVANPSNSRRLCLCTDDRLPGDLLERGHIDSMLRMAVGAGLSPLTAVQTATLNTARRFGLNDRGAVAVGYRADMVVLDDLKGFSAVMVFKDGRPVAGGGEQGVEVCSEPSVPPSTFNVAGFGPERLRVPAGGKARVIGLVPGQIVTETLELDLKVDGGQAVSDTESDVLKAAVVERHRGTGNVGIGFVRGFGLREGALASSVSHDSHNIVAVGVSDDDIVCAVEKIIEMNGGQVVVSGGVTRAELPLPIAGLMSTLSAGEAASRLEALNRQASRMGCSVTDPFITMSFLTLAVIPKLKLTDRGLVDVDRFEIVQLFV